MRHEDVQSLGSVEVQDLTQNETIAAIKVEIEKMNTKINEIMKALEKDGHKGDEKAIEEL